MTDTRARSPFGVELSRWRRARGMSQLRLASEAAMSPRYVSFVETGRSRPSRAVVLRLADALDVPLRERNRMLAAAGLAPAYAERPLDDAALAPFRRVVETLLASHEPYPGFALDRRYRLVQSNAAARRFVPDLEARDWIDASFARDSPVRAVMENFAEIAHSVLELVRREAANEEELGELVRRLEAHLEGVPRPALDERLATGPVLCPTFRIGERRVRTLTTVVRFGLSNDVTLDELRVELVFPADDESARFFAELAAS